MARPRLVLHFDVNNTILVADPVSNVSVRAALNTYLAGACWGREVDGQWRWAERTTAGDMVLSCPDGADDSYYKYLESTMAGRPRSEFTAAVGAFTDSADGHVAKPLFDRMLSALASAEIQEAPFAWQQDGAWLHYIIPSFWRLLAWLRDEGRDFAVVLRTYGTDGPEVAAAIQAFALGRHPDFPGGCPRAQLGASPTATMQRSDAGIRLVLEGGAGGAAVPAVEDEGSIFSYLSELQGTLVVRDDYEHWKRHGFTAAAGKPLWLVDGSGPAAAHHILFDDNIRTWTATSIADARLLAPQPGGGWAAGGPCEPRRAEAAGCLVQAALHQSVLDPDYFIDAVRQCEERFRARAPSPS